MYEQDAINGYVLQLAPEQKQAELLTQKPMWGAPFPTSAHTRNRFYHRVRSQTNSLLFYLYIKLLMKMMYVALANLRWYVFFQAGPLLEILLCLSTLYPFGMLVKVIPCLQFLSANKDQNNK